MPPLEIDKTLIRFVNLLAHQFPKFDHLVYMIAENNLLKGGLVFCFFYFLWWDNSKQKMEENRKTLILTIMSAFVAEIITILLSLTLPYRARPFTNSDISFSMPVDLPFWWDKGINSFPSDHATLFIVFGFGIFKCNRTIGFAGLSYILIGILLPRIYLGLHYPTDILAGMIVGIVVAYITFKLSLTRKITNWIFEFSEQKPYLFYPLLFIVSYQLVDLFTETREIIGYLRHPLGKL